MVEEIGDKRQCMLIGYSSNSWSTVLVDPIINIFKSVLDKNDDKAIITNSGTSRIQAFFHLNFRPENQKA